MTIRSRQCRIRVYLLLLVVSLATSPLQAITQTGDDTRQGHLRPVDVKQASQELIKKRPPSKSRRAEPTTYLLVTGDRYKMSPGFDVGITLWRLRLAGKQADLAVVEKQRVFKLIHGQRVESTVRLIPERVKPEVQFSNSDKLRLSVEAPFESYLYIVSQEQYSDGMLSAPFLVFPVEADDAEKSRALPGRLIDVPSEPDYFEISELDAGGKRKAAEVFSIIVSRMPVADLPPLRHGEEFREIDRALFERLTLAWERDVWIFQRLARRQRVRTRTEKNAAMKDYIPLTQSGPFPETIYHVAGKSEDTLLFRISLKIGSSKSGQ